MHISTRKFSFLLLILLAALLTACGASATKTEEAKTYTIGVLIQSPGVAGVLDGFKAGMTELGYIEGKNIVYLYDGPTGTIDAIKPEAEKLKAQKPDLLLVGGTPAAQASKEIFADTNIPIVAVPIFKPVEAGLVASLQQPGGHLTGIQSTNTIDKALEWLIQIVPNVKRIYVPFDPHDSAGVQSLQLLTDAAKAAGVELVTAEGSTPEQLDMITKNIPDGVDAAFRLRSGSIGSRANNLLQAANERHIPIASSDVGSYVTAGEMVGFGPGYFEMGQQATHLADLILNGSNPGTLPIENSEVFLAINLQTAQTLGIEISDEILKQAKQIVRPSSK